MIVRSYRLAQHGVRRRRKLYNRLTRSKNPPTILEWKRENQLDSTFFHQPRKKRKALVWLTGYYFVAFWG